MILGETGVGKKSRLGKLRLLGVGLRILLAGVQRTKGGEDRALGSGVEMLERLGSDNRFVVV